MLSAKRKAMGLGVAFLLSIFLVFASLPQFHGLHAGVRQNESAAVGSLRRIHELQTRFAAAHPTEGFACQLQRLRPSEDATASYDPTKALLSGEWSGYRFALAGCTPTEKEVVIHYQISAVPIWRRVTGLRAFCTDESGTPFYADSGSVTECVSARQPIF
jgi:hypothetical protein